MSVGQTNDVRDGNDDARAHLRLQWIAYWGRMVVRHTATRLAIGVIVLLVVAPPAAAAQPTGKVYRIGFILTATPNETEHLVKALNEGLRELGYVEGRNVVFERRFAEGRQERLPALATELVQLNVDVLVTGSNPVIAAVKQVTATIPVVMAVSRDPVGAGFIASLARPGGNITGLANDPAPEIPGKNLELLKEAAPRVSRVAYLRSNELESAFAAMVRERANGLVVASDPLLFGPRSQLALLAAQNRLPAVYPWREAVDAGGLMAYGPNLPDSYRRAAIYVAKILQGAKPGDLAVEQAAKFELVINLKAARALGLTIPQSLLLRADHIVE
jgi:putative tryptophan/tyrosine transport system substrate-binding protein